MEEAVAWASCCHGWAPARSRARAGWCWMSVAAALLRSKLRAVSCIRYARRALTGAAEVNERGDVQAGTNG